MANNTNCPKCNSGDIYHDGLNWACPMCGHEWNESTAKASTAEAETVEDTTVRDANGVALADGDSIVVLKDLKIKGSSSSVKSGTKVRNIRLHDAGDGHNISCKIDGVGSVNLKSEFVRKN